jgi:hypothetical protein
MLSNDEIPRERSIPINVMISTERCAWRKCQTAFVDHPVKWDHADAYV